MSRDFALLFPSVQSKRQVVVSTILPLFRSIGGVYLGIGTRMDHGLLGPFWRLSMVSNQLGSLSDINEQLESWDGLALELKSKFGLLKLMVWKDGDVTGFGLFETSSVFTAQAEDPDVCDIFDSLAVEMARATNSSAFCLVGDPGIASISSDAVISCLSSMPQRNVDPVVYMAGVKSESASSRSFSGVAPVWERLMSNGFAIFRAPDFGKPTDSD